MGKCPICNSEISVIRTVKKEAYVSFWAKSPYPGEPDIWVDNRVDKESNLDYYCPICSSLLFSGLEHDQEARELVK